MKFAGFSKHLTACLLAFIVTGCTTQKSQTDVVDFNRSEAVKARINLALAYLEQNEFSKAKQNIDKALAHDKTDYLPHSVLAYYYQQIGEPENAEKAYQTALELSKKQTSDKHPRPDVQNNYGTFLCKQGKFELAYRQFEDALQSKQPYYYQADTLENIALCANAHKNLPKQNEALSQLAKLDQTKAEILQKILK